MADVTSRDTTSQASSQSAGVDAPKRCADAIQKGLAEFQSGEFNEAIDSFTLALELPGKGSMRMADSPKEYSCPSEGEERAALYNMACCYARLEETDSGIAVLRGLLESGFDEYDTLRTDDDLAFLRQQPEFDELLDSFESKGPLAAIFGGQPKQKKAKGWLDRW